MSPPALQRWTDAFVERADASAPDPLAVRLLVWMGVCMSLGGMVWTALAVALDCCRSAPIPATYVVITAVNFTVFYRSGRFQRARSVQVTASLLLPLVFQLALGGVVASGAVMLWSVMALVASLTFSTLRESAATLFAFVVGSVAVTALDPSVAPDVDTPLTTIPVAWLFCANVVMVASSVAVLTGALDHLRRQRTRSLEAANDTIRELNANLTRAEQDARAASETKSRFVANMSHELRTPLNAIIGYAELILDDDALDVDASDDAARILSAGRHLLALVNDVLDVARLEAGEMTVHLEPVDVGAVVAEVTTLLGPLARQRGNRLLAAIELDHLVETDNQKLKQILLNLVSNANKFTERGQIDISVGFSQPHLVVRVRDTGIGMSQEALTRVLLPFQQADSSTTRRHGGTGLGLHLVRELALLLEGDVTLSSKEGLGTEVMVTLAARALPKWEPDQVLRRLRAATDPSASGSSSHA